MVALIRNVFLTLIYVLIIFTPPIRFLPHYTWFLALLGAGTLTDHRFKNLIGFSNNSNRSFITFLAFVLFFNSIIIPVTHGFADFSYIPLQLGIVLTLLRSVLLIYCLYKWGKGDILSQYSKFFFIACCIYVAFTLVFILDSNFKQFWLDTVLANVEDKSVEFAAYEFRYSLDGFAAFSSASVFSFACLFCSYRVAINRKINIMQIACLIIMVVGCFFYGRVSLVGMLLGAILIIWSSESIGKSIKIVAIILVYVLALLSILNFASQSNPSLVAWQEWAFSIIKQLFVEKEVTDYSVTHMVEDMYYFPDFFTILFGDGKYTNNNGTYYGHTDVGFMRLILYGGIACLLLVYSLLIFLSKVIARSSKSVVFKRFILLSTVLFFVLEMKGESYQRAIMMLYPLFLIQNYKNKINIQYDSKA